MILCYDVDMLTCVDPTQVYDREHESYVYNDLNWNPPNHGCSRNWSLDLRSLPPSRPS